MAKAQIVIGANGGGGGGYTFSPKVVVNAGDKPTWSTPFKANKAYILATGFSGSSRLWNMYTNVNPSTETVDNTKCWVTSDGNTWSDYTSYGFYWTITDSSITLERQVSGSVQMDCMFLIQ